MNHASRPSRAAIRSLAILSIAAVPTLAIAGPPFFNEIPSGTTYAPTHSASSNGVDLRFECFEWSNGATTCDGVATVEWASPECGSAGHRIELDNINLAMDFRNSVGTQNGVAFAFGDHGGNINLVVNGDFINFENMLDVDGMTLGGCVIRVLAGGTGNDCGTFRIEGEIDEMMIGGQEFWLDGLADDCFQAHINHDDLVAGTTWGVGDSTSSGGATISFAPLLTTTGPVAGYAGASPVDLTCGNGREIDTINMRARYELADSIGAFVNPLILIGHAGGLVNFGVNGSPVVVASDWADLDGYTAAGCTIFVHQDEDVATCYRIQVIGTVGHLVLGGEDHAIDCIFALDILPPTTVGDLNGDGCVDAADLGILFAAWGTNGGDINYDGTTDAADMGILLGRWGC